MDADMMETEASSSGQNAATDQLASLFAECAIVEVQPALSEPTTESSATTITDPPISYHRCQQDIHTGRKWPDASSIRRRF
ncbi:hypothetical protein RYX36_034334 [Vicia faba]